MRINTPLHGESIDPVMWVSYSRNAGLTLDVDLALLIVDVSISVRMWSCSNPHFKWNTSFLWPASEVEHRVA